MSGAAALLKKGCGCCETPAYCKLEIAASCFNWNASSPECTPCKPRVEVSPGDVTLNRHTYIANAPYSPPWLYHRGQPMTLTFPETFSCGGESMALAHAIAVLSCGGVILDEVKIVAPDNVLTFTMPMPPICADGSVCEVDVFSEYSIGVPRWVNFSSGIYYIRRSEGTGFCDFSTAIPPFSSGDVYATVWPAVRKVWYDYEPAIVQRANVMGDLVLPYMPGGTIRVVFYPADWPPGSGLHIERKAILEEQTDVIGMGVYRVCHQGSASSLSFVMQAMDPPDYGEIEIIAECEVVTDIQTERCVYAPAHPCAS